MRTAPDEGAPVLSVHAVGDVSGKCTVQAPASWRDAWLFSRRHSGLQWLIMARISESASRKLSYAVAQAIHAASARQARNVPVIEEAVQS